MPRVDPAVPLRKCDNKAPKNISFGSWMVPPDPGFQQSKEVFFIL